MCLKIDNDLEAHFCEPRDFIPDEHDGLAGRFVLSQLGVMLIGNTKRVLPNPPYGTVFEIVLPIDADGA